MSEVKVTKEDVDELVEYLRLAGVQLRQRNEREGKPDTSRMGLTAYEAAANMIEQLQARVTELEGTVECLEDSLLWL